MNVKTTLRTKVTTWVSVILRALTVGRWRRGSLHLGTERCWTIFFLDSKLQNLLFFFTILVGKSTSLTGSRWRILCALWTRKTGDTSLANVFSIQRTTL